MPTSPSSNAAAAAMANITMANDVRAIDRARMAFSVLMLAMGISGFASATTWRISGTRLVGLGRSVRTTYARLRQDRRGNPQKSSTANGRYTTVTGGRSTPLSWTLPTTPTISRHGPVCCRMRRPKAAAGEAQYSRAMFSVMTTTGARARTSSQFSVRPARSGFPMVSK